MVYMIGTHPKGFWPTGFHPTRFWPKAPSAEAEEESDDLAHSPCFIVGAYLIAESIVTLPSSSSLWPLFKSHLPDVVNDYGAILDTTPIIDGRVHNSSHNVHYGIQVIIKCTEQKSGMEKANAILSDLENVKNDDVVFDDYTYRLKTANPATSIIPLGLEPGTKRRYLISLNFLVVLKQMVAA